MTIEDKKRELAFDRIQQAEESLEEAKYLFDGKKSPRSVINRAYYAMFYAILAFQIFLLAKLIIIHYPCSAVLIRVP